MASKSRKSSPEAEAEARGGGKGEEGKAGRRKLSGVNNRPGLVVELNFYPELRDRSGDRLSERCSEEHVSSQEAAMKSCQWPFGTRRWEVCNLAERILHCKVHIRYRVPAW